MEGCALPKNRRAYSPAGIVVLTVVTYRPVPMLDGPANVAKLRQSLGMVMRGDPSPFPRPSSDG